MFCEAVECVRSRHRLASDGLNHVLILTMSVVVTVKRTTGSTHGKRHSIVGVGSGTTPLKRYQVVVRASCLSMLSEPIPFPYLQGLGLARSPDPMGGGVTIEYSQMVSL